MTCERYTPAPAAISSSSASSGLSKSCGDGGPAGMPMVETGCNAPGRAAGHEPARVPAIGLTPLGSRDAHNAKSPGVVWCFHTPGPIGRW